jgi:ATP-dependent RNA helicase DDX19/DBP5
VREIGKFTKITAFLCVPDAPTPPRGTGTLKDHVIVGTPGSVLALFGRQLVDQRAVRVLVLDEADVMIDAQGLGDQSLRLARLLPKKCQFLLFSATFPERVDAFARRLVPEPVSQIRLKPKELVIRRIQQFYINCKQPQRRFDVLADIYKSISIGQSIIFVQAIVTGERLAAEMVSAGHMVSIIHGKFSPDERDAILDAFRTGKTRVLIATNVLARGIDVMQVSLVINYDVPVDQAGAVEPETYLHRIGRTARYGRSGIAVNLVGDARALAQVQQIAEAIQHKIEELPEEQIDKLDDMLRECRKRDEENLRLLHLEVDRV